LQASKKEKDNKEMKFEKQLLFHAVPAWKHKYISYGKAKALLKRIEHKLVHRQATNGEEEEVGILEEHVEQGVEGLEQAFFSLLQEEKTKVAEFYEYQLQQLLARNTRLINQLSHFEAATQANKHLPRTSLPAYGGQD